MSKARYVALLLGAALFVLVTSARGISGDRPSLRPLVLRAGSGYTEPAEEKLVCHHKRAPASGLEVGRLQIVMPGDGGHHVILARPHPGKVEWPPKNCPLTLNFDTWELIAQTQHAMFDWQLPPGVGLNLSPHQPLLIQTHYLRGGGGKEGSRETTFTVLYPVDPATVTAHAGSLFLNDRSLMVPPHSISTATSRCTVTGDGAEARELKLLGITGHYHFRGVQFDVYRVNADGSLGELLYQYKGADQPGFRQFAEPVVLHSGEGIEWRCTYHNNTDKTFKYGPDAATQEHCILFGSYYPTDTPQEAINCVHDRDPAGNDTVTRIVIPGP